VRRGVTATADMVMALEPDTVVVATGATRGLPSAPGADLPHVWTGDALRAAMTGHGDLGAGIGRSGRAVLRVARLLRLTSRPSRVRRLSRWWLPLGRRVVVLGGGLVGIELAEFLAERRRSVTVLEPGPAAGLPMAAPRRWTAVRKAAANGVEVVRSATVVAITAGEVRYEVDGERRTTSADTVVVAGEVRPGAPLADALRDRDAEVHVVGDAADVGYIEGAIHSAWRVARAL
jgi:NADPH-dependent 2,4-dienoyl-CoA reductase/sulfur reductase-like enzyme